MKKLILGLMILAVFSIAAEAKGLHPRCNIDWPCMVATDYRVKSGNVSKREGRQIARANRFRNVEFGSPMYPPETQKSFLNGDLVERARGYIGRTGPALGLPSRLWCSDFMNMVTGGGTGSRLAKSWLAKPRISAQIGAIAVLGRGKHGGHVGVVSGFDGRGNPIIVSGNHGRRVGESIYPASRVIAYVSPS